MEVLKFAIALFFRAAPVLLVTYSRRVIGREGPTEAPTGFDNQTNGMVAQATFSCTLSRLCGASLMNEWVFYLWNRTGAEAAEYCLP